MSNPRSRIIPIILLTVARAPDSASAGVAGGCWSNQSYIYCKKFNIHIHFKHLTAINYVAHDGSVFVSQQPVYNLESNRN